MSTSSCLESSLTTINSNSHTRENKSGRNGSNVGSGTPVITTSVSSSTRLSEKMETTKQSADVVSEANEKRLWRKRANASSDLVAEQKQKEQLQTAGAQLANKELAKEKEKLPIDRVVTQDWATSPYVFRYGGFAQRYASTGVARSIDETPEHFWSRIWGWLLHRRPGPVMDPLINGGTAYAPHDIHRDLGEVVSLNFRGFAAFAGISWVVAWLLIAWAILGWAASQFGFFPPTLLYPMLLLILGLVVQLIFTVDERYSAGDWMIEVSKPVLEHFSCPDPMDRRPSSRDVPVSHECVLATVTVQQQVIASNANFISRGWIRLFGPWYYFWHYDAFFHCRTATTTKLIDLVLASNLSTVLQLSSARGYDSLLQVAKTAAARINCINYSDFTNLSAPVIENTCKYAVARHCSRPESDFRPEASLPF